MMQAISTAFVRTADDKGTTVEIRLRARERTPA
jgi:hypothetical protein